MEKTIIKSFFMSATSFMDIQTEEFRRLSENEIFFPRSRKAKIITTGIH